MKTQPHDESAEPDDMQPEYDFSHGVRGKYADCVAAGPSFVLLDADMVPASPDSDCRERFLRAANADYEALRQDAAAWAEELQERELLAGTLADDLEKE